MAISSDCYFLKATPERLATRGSPDGAEMRIEVGLDGQLDLVAFSGNDQYALMMGELPFEDDATNGMLH